jgi:hypothetical protein
MRNVILKYGVIAGIAMAALMFATTFFLDKVGYSHAEAIGYTCMILGYLPILLGVRKYRDDVNGGTISFGRAAGTAILAALLANVFYVAAWLFIYYNMPEVMEKYATYTINQMKAAGTSQKDMDTLMSNMQHLKELYKNPLINAAVTYLEPLFGTIVFSLVTGLITMRKKATLPLEPK